MAPFQNVTDSQAAAAAAWDASSSQSYAPPPRPPPASARGWEPENKGKSAGLLPTRPPHTYRPDTTLSLDLIDLTNDTDADDDLRRAMAASLQDHQSQQTYRPPAPSSTVGVSEASTTSQWQDSTQRANHIEKTRRRSLWLDDIEYHPSSPSAEIRAGEDTSHDAVTHGAMDEDDEHAPENGIGRHAYRLRDRRKLVRPTHTGLIFSEMGRQAKLQRTYKDRPNQTNRRPGQRRRARRGRTRKGCSWTMVRASLLFCLPASVSI